MSESMSESLHLGVFRNPFVAIVAMWVFALVRSDLWTFVVSALLGWVIADTIFNFLIRGGEGIFQTRLAGSTHTQAHGYGYLVFLFVVALATFASSEFTKWLMPAIQLWLDTYNNQITYGTLNIANFLVISESWLYSAVIVSILAALIAYLDLHVRFYKRD